MFAFERLMEGMTVKPFIPVEFRHWHSNSKNARMKRQPRYRTLTIALGIVVALLIVITLWTTRGGDTRPAAMDGGKETSFALKSAIRLQPVINILK
jgi:hypothetical protein